MKQKFTGPLAKPFRYVGQDPGSQFPEREFVNKLSLLFEHYGIEDQRNWAALAIYMAMDLVPGFKLKGPNRRRPKRPLSSDVMLIADVGGLIEERPGRSVSEAVSILVTSSRFARTWGGKNKRTLENTFHEAVRSKAVTAFLDSLGRDLVEPEASQELND